MRHYTPKPCVHNVHQLLGSIVRDARQDRSGRVVGIDQTREHPVIDIIWAGQKRAERITITLDQLQALVEACLARTGSHAERETLQPLASGEGNVVSKTRRYRA